jgi:DNA sulfur modification protein DndB
MGDWIYYAVFLRLKDVAERVSLADEIHKHQGLRDMVQRSIDSSSHAESIKRYLLKQKQRLFNALVIGVYGGTPHWTELDFPLREYPQGDILPDYFEGALGILQLDGSENLFAIDGQHRVVGIKRALEAKPGLGEEEVVALFVPHTRDEPGMERSRRLFTTLNRYAKPVSKMDIIALDEDDVIAIVTRMLVERYPLFEKFLKIKKGKQLSVNDAESFTSIETLYDCLDRFLATGEKWNEFKRARPSESVVNKFYDRACSLFDSLQQRFSPIAQLARSKPEQRVALRFRNRAGGHFLFRPIGLMIAVDVLHGLMAQGWTQAKAVSALSNAPMELSEYPWSELLWNSAAKRMITSGENQRVAYQILYHGIGGNLEDLGRSEQAVRSEWAGILGRNVSTVKLRCWNR